MASGARSRLAVPHSGLLAYALALHMGSDPIVGESRSTLARRMAALGGLAKVTANSGGILTTAVLSLVYLYSLTQPAGGYLHSDDRRANKSGLRSWLASSALARHSMRFRMRDGSFLRSRIVDSGGLLSVHVDRDYDVPGVNWPRVRTIVDIGAHVGSFTVWAARRALNARIFAVEPNPETFQLLIENINRNGLQNRVNAVNAAVADAAGTVELELVEHSLGTRIARKGRGTIEVRAETMHGLLAEAGIDELDVLKIDCEGMEYAVLKTMGPECFRRIKTLACEYHPVSGNDVSELDSVLRSAGFHVKRPAAPLGVLWATR